jgi:hypothetical protein
MFKVAKHAKINLTYPDHLLDPDHLVTFIEAHGFGDDWKQLGLNDKQLWILQAMIGANPKGPKVIPGTDGLRKLRFAPHSKSGRREWFRVCYAYFQEAGVVLLVVAYAKSELDDLPAGHKKSIREMLKKQKAIFDKGVVR